VDKVVALQNIIRANGGTKGCRTVRGFADEFEFSALSWTGVMKSGATR
jgi:hypothetical protein